MLQVQWILVPMLKLQRHSRKLKVLLRPLEWMALQVRFSWADSCPLDAGDHDPAFDIPYSTAELEVRTCISVATQPGVDSDALHGRTVERIWFLQAQLREWEA